MSNELVEIKPQAYFFLEEEHLMLRQAENKLMNSVFKCLYN